MEQQDRPGWNPPSTTPATPDVPLSSTSEVSSVGRRSRVGTGVAIAAIGIGALGLAGTAYAASSTPTPTPDSGRGSENAPAVPGAPGGAPGGMPGMGGPHGDRGGDGPGGKGHGMRGAGMGIHGTFVAPKQGGGYQTVHTQRGTVTGVSSTSITVKSEDSYTKTYVVTADTVVNAQRDGIASVKAGDEVMVVGIESGDTVTAVQVMDRTRVAAGMKPLAPPQPSGTTVEPSGTTA